MSAWQPGTVYAAALNRRSTLDRLGNSLCQDPYRAPPNAPILHIKPANTVAASDAALCCPLGVESLRMGATIGLVMGRRASRVSAETATSYVAAAVLAIDVSIPYQSHYRPAIRERCRDGFLPLGTPLPLTEIGDPDRIEITIEVAGIVRNRSTGSDFVRGTSALLSAVSSFLTLEPGDVLLLGEPDEAPLARPGDLVRVLAGGFEPLVCHVVTEEAP